MKVSLQTFLSSSQEKKGNSRNKQKQIWEPICDNVYRKLLYQLPVRVQFQLAIINQAQAQEPSLYAWFWTAMNWFKLGFLLKKASFI